MPSVSGNPSPSTTPMSDPATPENAVQRESAGGKKRAKGKKTDSTGEKKNAVIRALFHQIASRI